MVEQPPLKKKKINFLSYLTGSFMNPIITASIKKQNLDDKLVDNEAVFVEKAHDEVFQKHWENELLLEKASDNKKKSSLRRALWKSFRKDLLLAAGLKLLWAALVMLSITYLIRQILSYIQERVNDPDHTSTEQAPGWYFSCIFFVCTVLLSYSLQHMNAVSAVAGLKVKSALITAIYRKIFTQDRYQSHLDVVSLVSTDCAKLADSCTTLQFLWSGVIEALAIIGFLVGVMREAALPGLGLVVLLIPVQYFIGLSIAKMRKKVAAAAEERVQLMDEILRAIKLVKMYAWEKSFASKVAVLRNQEAKLAHVNGLLKSINLALVFVLPPLIALAIFGLYVKSNVLQPSLVFTVLSMFNTLRLPLVQLPKGLRAFAEATSALERLQSFLLSPDRKFRQKSNNTEIIFNNANFTYGKSTDVLLKNINLNVKPGDLVMIAGPVGSGKSNILQACLGQMTLLSGQESVGGSIAYVPQTPWCSLNTVRENILFGKPWDEYRYRKVLHACALERDLQLMDHGDLTEIGERGLNLSGGQKQRIALARAAYAGASLILLDAPLSAVDMYTCSHIFKHCIQGMMLSEGAAVVLVTHQVQLFSAASHLIVMDKGEQIFSGPYTKQDVKRLFPNAGQIPDTDAEVAAAIASATGIMTDDIINDNNVAIPSATSPSALFSPEHSRRISTALRKDRGMTFTIVDPLSESSTAPVTPSVDHIQKSNSYKSTPATTPRERGYSAASTPVPHYPSRAHSGSDGIAAGTDALNPSGQLFIRAASLRAEVIRAAERAVSEDKIIVNIPDTVQKFNAKNDLVLHESADALNNKNANRPPVAEIKINGYVEFFKAVKWYLFVPSLIIFGVTQITRIFSDIWISLWVGKRYPDRSQEWYTGVYGGYVGTFLLLLLLRGFFYYRIGLRAASRMHNSMFSKILKAPMSFFTVTPLGSVLSVFARDMDQIDEALLDNIHMVIIYFAILGTTIGVVIRVINVYAAVAGALLLASIYFFRYYIGGSGALKELAGTTSASVASQVSETLQGLAVVQAYGAETRFANINAVKVNKAQKAAYNFEMLQLWLSTRLDFLGCLLVLSTCLLCVGLENNLPAAQAGLAVSNSFQILLFFSLMVRGAADIHGSISSVERVVKLEKVEPEKDLPLTRDTVPEDNWPFGGEVIFHNVVMSYLPNAPHVLKGVDFHIRRGEKIGVVGRTGAGKSSLIMSLFRLAELAEGAIRIDGIDCKNLNLSALRSAIAIIPQEPVMFKGTLRSNLDPFNEKTDEELFKALEKCLLGDLVKSSTEGLNLKVSQMGDNFSLGQQQLMCLARALLNDSKLLVLDEATAALDSDTDSAIQKVLRTEFADRTVITIAHRLDTIIDSDRILVMDAGRVAEFDTPYDLLSKPESIFSSLCRQTGAQYDVLLAAAHRHAVVQNQLLQLTNTLSS